LRAIVLYRLAFLVLECRCGLGSVSRFVVGGVVDEMWNLERAIVPLVKVVLFRFVDQPLFMVARHG
jgi:hypothetical protein